MPSSSVRPIHTKLNKINNEDDKPKHSGKRKAKAAPSESVKVTKKTKKPVPKLRSPSPVLQEESKERTVTEVQEDNTLRSDEEDTAHSEPATIETLLKVSSHPSSSLTESDIFDNIMNEPFLNLAIPLPPPPFNLPSSQMTSSPITSSILMSSTLLYHKRPSTSIPPFDDDVEILFGDDHEPIIDFIFHPFTININNDDDEAQMTKARFKQLNEKLDSVLKYSHAFSSTKWENLLMTHRAMVEMITSSIANVLEETTKANQASKQKIIETTEKIQGVSGCGESLKQGGEEEENLKNEFGLKDNEASGSGKDKGNIVSKEDFEENPKMIESKIAAREKRDKELDQLNTLKQQLDAEEVEVKI
ncbi:unnamed protein product [Lactuca saligna]|uniref:Uncharacterized protein n=1 Tax=Lactuca saligna TaxID=75948 RepID=A0AA36A2W4_LACSI|nr:unnamed protein product [Lactuca saligna]